MPQLIQDLICRNDITVEVVAVVPKYICISFDLYVSQEQTNIGIKLFSTRMQLIAN